MNYLDSIYDGVSYYTASLSPHLQGVDIKETWQIFDYTNIKIRSNSDFTITLDGVEQNGEFFNESLAGENLGRINSGSSVNLDTIGRIGQKVSHRRQYRDIGKSLYYENINSFSDSDCVEMKPAEFISSNNNNFPFELNNASSIVQFDGVIEPFSIRRIIDRKNKNVSYKERGIHGEIEKSNNEISCDFISLNDQNFNPWIDETATFANIDLPRTENQFNNSFPFIETTQLELNCHDINDSQISNLLINGFTSGTIVYKEKNCEMIDYNNVYSRRGFCFSQVDNYKFDSIAFAGLNRNNKNWND